MHGSQQPIAEINAINASMTGLVSLSEEQLTYMVTILGVSLLCEQI